MNLDNNKPSLTPAAWSQVESSSTSVGIRMILVIFCISVFAGCAGETGTKTPMNAGALSKIDNLHVQVRVDQDFSVHLASEEVNGSDAVFLLNGGVDMAGRAVLHGIRSHEDAERAKNLRMAIAEINLQSLAQKALVDGLQASLRFKSVTAVTEREGTSPTGAGVLLVRIENWGLFAGSANNAAVQKVQLGITASASLVGGDGKIAWGHRDFFTSGAHHPIGEYVSSPDLLKSEIEETARRYCARVVNEIRYAH